MEKSNGVSFTGIINAQHQCTTASKEQRLLITNSKKASKWAHALSLQLKYKSINYSWTPFPPSPSTSPPEEELRDALE